MIHHTGEDHTTSETTPTNSAGRTAALVILALVYFVLGFVTCLNDTLVPFFRKGFMLNYSQSALVQFYFFLTYAVLSIPTSKLVIKIGYRKGIVLGFIISATGAAMFFPASLFNLYSLFLLALFILAAGFVLLQVAVNPYVTILGDPKTASSRFTLVQGVGSIGTTLAPIFGAGFILSKIDKAEVSSIALQIPYVVIAIVLILIALFFYRIRFPAISVTTNKTLQERSYQNAKSVFSFRNLNFGIVAIFMYVGAEVAIGTFLTNFISDTVHISDKEANKYVSFYWGGMLIGRLLGSFLLRVISPPAVLSFLAAIAMLLIIGSSTLDGYWAIYSLIAIGLCNSIMFATIFSLSVAGLKSFTMPASGLLSTAIVGGAVIPYVMGVVLDSYTWVLAFMVPFAAYAYILFYGLYGYRSKFSNGTL